jgi:hypothetical protein
VPFDALEYAVRPFTTPNAQGTVIIPSTPRGSRQKATLKWGVPVTIPPVQTGVNFNVVCCKDNLTEKDRKVEPLRVYQGGDQKSPNYIDWERPLSMNLDKKESNTCGDNWEDISWVAQEVSADLAAFSDAIHSGTAATPDKNCGQGWKFKSKL